ncbi:hypothetical protein [Pelagicoccus sp. SDUM812002]|uniref:hypothetical protein n=1 Tax=Pelagicoccus sp. SDUM812002 TaxID=3041266 RepID=UPI00280E16B6|nr:hypothetical protein [Pelagicoccus sp. SDUM812002]MDQ8185770.1 hypothetical protein [Pelagicoccus sp. SDUM812002]
MTDHTYSLPLKRILVAFSLLLTSSAFGGYVYEFQESESGTSTSLMVEGSKLRVTTGADQNSDMIYDTSTSTMIILEHDRKRYMELDKATLDDLSRQIEDAMAEMEKQLASMPPAQRKMMEGLMKGKMGGAEQTLPELSFDRTGDTNTISGYDVEKVVVLEDGSPARELWVADWDDVEGSEELITALTSMGEMLNNMTKAFSKGPLAGMMKNRANNNWYGRIEDIGGIPVAYSELGGKAKQSQTTLSRVEERDFEANFFEIPKGYKKQKMK